MTKRNGKIARLPLAVREELNVRLADHQESDALLPWLNGLPEVRAVLAEFFHGAEISKQNLSEWRLGGFREWEARRGLLEAVAALEEGDEEMEVDVVALAGKMAKVLMMRYAGLVSKPMEELGKAEGEIKMLRRMIQDVEALQRIVRRTDEMKEERRERVEQERKRQQHERTYGPVLNILRGSNATAQSPGQSESNRTGNAGAQEKEREVTVAGPASANSLK